MKGSQGEAIRAVALLGLVVMSVTGCDYWPPALQAQIERLRVDVQTVSEERVKVEGQLEEVRKSNRDLQARIAELTRINQEQTRRLATLEAALASEKQQSQTARPSVSSTSKSSRRTAGSEGTDGLTGGRVLQLERPHLKGADVKKMQQALRKAGIAVSVDGIFGTGMEAAVRRFQQQKGLTADGVVGTGTRAALARVVSGSGKQRVLRLARPHMQGLDIKAVQQALQKRGLPVAVDGVFGPSMQMAVKQFQRRKGLIPDGVVGPSTWAALGF